MGKKCDLCEGVARMHCESDQASLCWNCDARVHGANFLVAKHTRCLLCSACQSPTPWKATGLRLGPTFSICDSCVALKSAGGAGVSTDQSQEVSEVRRLRSRDDSAESYDDGEDEDEDEEYSDEDEEEDDDVDDDEEAENQVVPWSAAAAAAAQLPPVMSSSSSDGGGGDLATKRTRRDYSDEEIGCSSSAQESNFSPPLKRQSRDDVAFKGERVSNGAVDSSPSSSSSLIFAISKTRGDLSR
ncbi:zinc finger protein CONSTANS-LIKE 1 [Raphanus sativus]|uniref:Zinc finger protein CONSTANS-LIKE 1 n=1 Tax=Raphanus sativus TaxID=3726 RepID=A0A6J0MGY7_RAPSA|nr:zinc finger protein CONSTANS-LIKE 1 [Raphanus sativus]